MNHHLERLIQRYPVLVECASDIDRAVDMIDDCYRGWGKLLLCGNGGSAADAEHWAAELLKGFAKKRPLTFDEQSRLTPDLATTLQRALPAIPLTGFPSLATAFANDVDARFTYAQLVWALGKPGDVLVGISTSGNSQNVVNALQAAEAKDMPTIVLTGRTGGIMGGIARIAIKAPASEVHEVQELHLPIYHAICLMLEERFFPA